MSDLVGWAQKAGFRASLRELPNADGKMLLQLLEKQASQKVTYPLSQADQRKLKSKHTINTEAGSVVVEVPDEEEELEQAADDGEEPVEPRESFKIQAALTRIGAEMGFRVWLPKSDKQRVMDLLPVSNHAAVLEKLPLNYDDTTLKTIEQIDVIWLKSRAMARAFEVEHTTAIYSGLLRMADLLALQPNINIRLHIVAPDEKRDKVLREIRRPVFSLLGPGPLYESCTYISYESINQIGTAKHLSHMSDSILEEYEESAQDD